jgi:peptide/nickel transport system permease protein
VEPLIEEAELARTGSSTDAMASPLATPPKKVSTQRKSPNQIALARLRTDKVAMICLGIFVFFVLIAIFAPLLTKLEGQDATTLHQDLTDEFGFPTIGATSDHWFGVEPRLGRDLFARWVYGARPSLIVAGSAVLLLIFGGSTGATADTVARVRFISLICVLSFFGWAGLARLIRGQVLSLRERDFVAAARVLGVPTHRLLFKELLPNLVAPIVVSVSLALPSYIVAEAGLTFLGVGLTEPTPSWGLTIAAAQTYYRADPLYLWLPVLGIAVLVLALSLLGDAVRDAFDPKTRR